MDSAASPPGSPRSFVGSEASFQALVRSATDAIVVADRDGRIVSWNDAATRMFGRTAEEVFGRPVRILMPERYREAHEAGLARVRESGRSDLAGRTLELHGLRSDGSEFPIELSLSAWSEGDRTFFTAIIRDVTERVETEAELRRRARELEQANRELERSNRELDRFASIASHDLREPLRAMDGFASLLERRYGEDLDDEAAEFLGFITEGVERMRRLLDGLLAYSRATSSTGSMEWVDADALLDEVLDGLRVSLEETAARVTRDPLPTVRADPPQLARVFQNLLENAIKHRDDGPASVHVSGRREHGSWRFEIRDEGIGIPEGQQESIFEMYRRLRPEESDGTGVGLAICRQIIERHEGTIGVHSEPGEGSTFHFTLPVPEEEGPPADEGEPATG